jgi:nitroreductase
MDTFLAIASRREVRNYSEKTLPDDLVKRILEAGRLSGSSTNKQPWRFLVIEDRSRVEQLAQLAYTPQNLLTASLVVVVAVPGSGRAAFDAGRATQNMLLTAWDAGVGSCPNGVRDRDEAARVLDLAEDESPVIVLTFGYPTRSIDPSKRSAEEWTARANRKPFDEVVERL